MVSVSTGLLLVSVYNIASISAVHLLLQSIMAGSPSCLLRTLLKRG
jgi:hypothetical protein